MRFRSLILVTFSSALTLSMAACGSNDDSGTVSAAGSSAKGGSGGSGGGAGKAATGGEAGVESGGQSSAGGPSGGPAAAGAAGDDTSGDSAGAAGSGNELTALPTLDGAMPLVIGHRGLPGLHPEETEASYDGAVDAGADSLEEDLHLTKDCVLVARHNPWLSDNTNITAVAATNATVMARKRTVPGVMVDVKYSVATYGGPPQYLTSRSTLTASVPGSRK